VSHPEDELKNLVPELPSSDPGDRSSMDRREMLQLSGTVIGSIVLGVAAPDVAMAEAPTAPPSPDTIKLTINGQRRNLALDPRTSLLDALREHVHLTGTKKGCDQGQCGACTVLINGARINSCLTLAVMHEDDEIVTIEGLGSPGALHPMQAAFVERDGFQCGYCTSGQICSAVAMLTEVKAGWPSHVTADVASSTIALTDGEIRERMSGNICRCAAYSNIAAAIRDVAQRGGK
jgi:xanthine dehydrogenase YagT iron-sulfur-binding subunit